jgi:general secretion pathway protein E
MTETLNRLVTADTSTPRLREAAIKEGLRPLRISGALKVKMGLTTPQEVFNVVPSEDEYSAG